jgi:hypothetical protein
MEEAATRRVDWTYTMEEAATRRVDWTYTVAVGKLHVNHDTPASPPMDGGSASAPSRARRARPMEIETRSFQMQINLSQIIV